MSEAIMCDICTRTFRKDADGPEFVRTNIPIACLPEHLHEIGTAADSGTKRSIDVCGGCQEALAVMLDRLFLDRFGSTTEPVEPAPTRITTEG